MRTMSVTELAGPAAVKPLDLPRPRLDGQGCGGEQILVDVHAAGVAFPDLLRSYGRYQERVPVPFPTGSEAAGIVVEAAPGSRFQAGDRVAGLCKVGGVAEQVLIDSNWSIKLPAAVDFRPGAAIVLNYMTALFTLQRSHLKAGDLAVVHGAAGGVGTASLQLLANHGVETVAVVSSEEKAAMARACGASHIAGDDWRDAVAEIGGGRGADAVFDPVGGDRFQDSMRCLRPGGRLLVIGFAAGDIPSVAMNRVLMRNIELVGIALEGYEERFPGSQEKVMLELERLTAGGVIDPPLDTVFPFEQGAGALCHIEARKAIGKVIIDVRNDD